MTLELGLRTTKEQRQRRCDKCGGQPWAACFWWSTADGPSGCPEGGNVFTCSVAQLQHAMHLAALRAAEEAGCMLVRKLDLYEILNRNYGHEIATHMIAQLAAAPKASRS